MRHPATRRLARALFDVACLADRTGAHLADHARGLAVACVNTAARMADKAICAWPNVTGDDE